jgi:peptidoglycan glycosyltransferase
MSSHVTRRRSTEAGLIAMVAVITAAAYTLAALGTTNAIPARLIPFLVGVIGLLVVAHLAVRRLAPAADGTLLPLAALLHGIGYVMITRLDSDLAARQATWSLIAVAAFVATLIAVPRITGFVRIQWWLLGGAVALLVSPFLPGLGVSRNGARIWVSAGPINFQPGEIAKVLLAIFFAAYLADRRALLTDRSWRIAGIALPRPGDLLPIAAGWGVAVMIMVGQRDLGSSLLFFTLFVVMLWIATERLMYLVLGVVLFAGAAWMAWRMFGHVQVRVDIWLDPWADRYGRGYQIVQALYGLADGGIVGTGLGRGSPELVPEAQNDFIYAAIGEELGLIGASSILMAYLLIIGAGLRVAVRTNREIEKLLAVGLTTIVGMQAFIIIGGVLKVVPLTGITLPFVSYGGSSLVANYVLLALLMRLSDMSAVRLGERPDEPTWAEKLAAWRVRRRAGVRARA